MMMSSRYSPTHIEVMYIEKPVCHHVCAHRKEYDQAESEPGTVSECPTIHDFDHGRGVWGRYVDF